MKPTGHTAGAAPRARHAGRERALCLERMPLDALESSPPGSMLPSLPAPKPSRRANLALSSFAAVLLIGTGASAQQTLSLPDAMDQLEQRNLQVEVAEQTVRQAEELRRQALALLRPNVNLSAAYTLRDEEIELDFGNPFAPLAPFLEAVYSEHSAAYPDLFDPAVLTESSSEPQIVQYRHDVMGSITIDQSLYNARALPFIRQARIGIRQAENAVELVLYQLQGAVTQAYFAAVLQQRLIEVAERSVELARLANERARIAFEEDVGNRFEVTRTSVELSRAERDLDNARTGYRIAIRNLATLLQRDADFDVVAPEPIVGPERPAPPADLPGLVAHDLELERHDERLIEARNRWFPTFYARAQGNLQRESAFGGDRFSWYLQLGASWDIYDGGERDAQRRVREQERIAEEIRREQTLAELQAAIDNALLTIEQLERNVETARSDIALARETVELTDVGVSLGTARPLDAQVAREQLTLAELSLVTAEVNLQATIYDLLRIVGDTPWR